MKVDIISLFLILIPIGISLLLMRSIRDRTLRILGVAVVVAFFIYSGMGLALYDVEERDLYILQFALATISFSVTIILLRRNTQRKIERHKDVNESVFSINNGLLIKVLAIIYIITFLFPFVYPQIDIGRIFRPASLISNYFAVTSAQRLALSRDSLYQLVCSTIRTLCLPAFFILIYQKKEKPFVVIGLYTLVTYLSAMSMNYISRNELAVYLLFVYIYLYKEEILPRRVLRIAAYIGIPVIIIIFASIFYIRLGFSTNNLSNRTLIESIFSQETQFVNNYPKASQLSGEVSGIMFFIYVLTCFLPMSIRSIFGVREIALSQVLSNNILNMKYGDRGYYLLLPSVLGEGIMVFNKYFAWLYLIFFGIMILFFYKKIRRNPSMEYLLVYFIIDVVRQMRGGSQFIISTWMASLIPFLFVCYLVDQVQVTKVRRTSLSGSNCGMYR